MTSYIHSDWSSLVGTLVEVRRDGQLLRKGLVDAAMADSSVLWLAADVLHSRSLIEASEGYEVWVEPRKLAGPHSYRMTAAMLALKPPLPPRYPE